jgi:threonine synthase
MPKDTPKVFRIECEAYGANVVLVDGLIDDCGKIVAQRKEAEGWFDVSTLKEPYRVEGKKTMGYEIAEQLGWTLPDVVVYPTGGGTGLIGMWKAFDEMETLGWIGAARPRMVSVQAEGCAPIPRAFAEGKDVSVRFENAHTYASGLRVPKAYADYLILEILRASKGEAVIVTDDEMRRGVLELASHEGLFAAPEGGAAWEAVKKLVALGKVEAQARIVVFDTGTGYKYVE